MPTLTIQAISLTEIELSNDVLTIVESVLKQCVLENDDGMFRWQEDISDLHLFCSVYRLRFVQSSSIFGFKVPLKNTVVLTLEKVDNKPNCGLLIRWQVHSLCHKFLCKNIIKETELAIREACLEPEHGFFQKTESVM